MCTWRELFQLLLLDDIFFTHLLDLDGLYCFQNFYLLVGLLFGCSIYFGEKKYWSPMTIIPELSISPSVLSVFASCTLRLHCLMFLTPHISLWTLLASFLFASIAIAIPVIYNVQQLPVSYFLTNVLEIGLSLFSKLWVESKTDSLYKKERRKAAK